MPISETSDDEAHVQLDPVRARVPADSVDFDEDPEARLYTGEPIEDEDGNLVRPQQQNVGMDNMEGFGEFPGNRPAKDNAPGAGAPDESAES